MAMPWTGTGLYTQATWRVPPLSGALTDPSTVILKFKSGEDAEVTWTFGTADPIVRESLGVYSAVVPTTDDDDTVIVWIGTGAAQAPGVRVVRTQATPL